MRSAPQRGKCGTAHFRLWASPRIVGELVKLGIHVAKATVEKYMVRPRKPPSATFPTAT